MCDTIIINLLHKCGTQSTFFWVESTTTLLFSIVNKVVESKRSPHWDQSPQLDHSLLRCQISKIQHVWWQGQLLLIFQLPSGMTPSGDCMEILTLWHQFLHPCYKLFPFLIRKFIQHEEVSFFIWRNQFCQFWKAFFSSLSLFPSYNIFSYISSLLFVLPTHYESQAITTLFFLPLFQSVVMMPQNGLWLIEWAAEFINHGWYSTLGLAKNNRYLRHPSYTRWVSRLPVSGPYQGEWQIHLVPYERLYTDFSFGIVWHCIYLHAAKPVLWRSFGYLV